MKSSVGTLLFCIRFLCLGQAAPLSGKVGRSCVSLPWVSVLMAHTDIVARCVGQGGVGTLFRVQCRDFPAGPA